MTQDSTHAAKAQWLDQWLEAQRSWLTRWQQAMAQQPTPDMSFAKQFDPQTFSMQAMQAVQSFQSLLQSSFVHFDSSQFDAATRSAMGTAASQPLWQQIQQAFALGPAREHQMAWQEYVLAEGDYRMRQQAVFDAYAKVFSASLDAVRVAAEQRSAQGQPVNGVRELYELWIECGERSFAQLARDETFMTTQASSANALSRLQLARNVLLDHWLKLHDLTTRSEMNSVHLRLRELSARVAQLEQSTAAKPKSRPRKPGKQA